MNWWQWYWSLAGCMSGFVLGFFAGRCTKTNWRHVAVAAAAGAFWPVMLLAGWWIDKFERNESA
jgi:hypothetical protein